MPRKAVSFGSGLFLFSPHKDIGFKDAFVDTPQDVCYRQTHEKRLLFSEF